MITKEKWQKLLAKMQALNIFDEDLEEKFILGGGKGGQKINKTASTVFLKHLPTGIIVKCQESRFREDNRYHARYRLLEKITEQHRQEKSRRQQLAEKIRRQKRKRSKRAQEKILANKHERATTKQLRKPPQEND